MVKIELARPGRKRYVVHVQGLDDIDKELARIPALLADACGKVQDNPLADIEAINDFADLLLEERHAMTSDLVELVETSRRPAGESRES